ncbi:hypothetical protein [Thorsellia kenyensis]|uniref:Integrase n=1 Tax=Thorsellia kenyensis TaxID=1549888 RepID=A0ABV6CBU7_9GAMM
MAHLRASLIIEGTMASFTKTERGFRAFIKVDGTRESKSFKTKREATEWATARELQISESKSKPLGEQFTLRDALRKCPKLVDHYTFYI